MKIAIVAPSPIPFMVGGAEKLWQGFYRYLSESTKHQVDLIKVPTKEHSLVDLVASYVRFSELDLSGFDCVISTKYPAWAINHPRHIVYLQHKLRGLYDTYNGNLGFEYSGADSRAKALLGFMQEHRGQPASFAEFVQRFNAATSGARPEADFLAFPGPFARSVLHYLDSLALHTDRVERFAAISHEVRVRTDYFPAGSHVDVIHHPTSLQLSETPHQSATPYLFLAGRLDSPKRHTLLIDAFKTVKSNLTLKIAGTGPLLSELQVRANDDPRIEFLGFVSDEEVGAYYQGALAIPFFPLYEDYGLISLEAMMAGKPVITTNDAGGAKELVEHERTGLVVEPTVPAIASAIDQLANDVAMAKQLGQAGRTKAADITWERLLTRLVPQAASSQQRCKALAKGVRRKVTVAVPYPIYPPRGGGQSRVFHLYRNLAKRCDVDLITLAEPHHEAMRSNIAPGINEVRIPITAAHFAEEDKLRKESAFLQLTDIALPSLFSHTPAFVDALKASLARADIGISCQAYTLPAMQSVWPKSHSVILGLESQNVEYLLKKSMLPQNPGAERLLNTLRELELRTIQESQFVLTCSHDDSAHFRTMYQCPADKLIWTPNGVDTNEVPFVGREARQQRKKATGLSSPVALFIGSWHQPNVEAVAQIEALAPQFPQVAFLIAGSVGLAPRKVAPPSNMRFLGVVSDEQRLALLALADIALNPMPTGSGTNLKMLDYLAAGIPIVSSEVGARGLALVGGQHYCSLESKGIAATFEALLNDVQSGAADNMIQIGRDHVVRAFDWAKIADSVFEKWQTIGIV